MSKVPTDIPTTIFISPMPKVCFYAVAGMEIIHSIPLAPETTLRHERFDNMREVPFDEFVACHPQSHKCVAQLTDFFCERESYWRGLADGQTPAITCQRR
jgi:hypothetical protein